MRKSLHVVWIGAALLASLVFSAPVAMADVTDGYHNADISKMVFVEKAHASAEAVAIAPTSHKVAHDVHLESNPKIAMADYGGNGGKLCMAGCNTKSERLSNTRLNL